MIGVGKQGGFGEKLTATRGMQDHKVVIDGAANQPEPTAFDLLDRRSRITLRNSSSPGARERIVLPGSK